MASDGLQEPGKLEEVKDLLKLILEDVLSWLKVIEIDVALIQTTDEIMNVSGICRAIIEMRKVHAFATQFRF